MERDPMDRIHPAWIDPLIITANILMSLAIDHFGLLRVEPHPMSLARLGGADLMF